MPSKFTTRPIPDLEQSKFEKIIKPYLSEDGKTVSYSTWYLRPEAEWKAMLKEERRRFWKNIRQQIKSWFTYKPIRKDDISTYNAFVILFFFTFFLYWILLIIAYNG